MDLNEFAPVLAAIVAMWIAVEARALHKWTVDALLRLALRALPTSRKTIAEEEWSGRLAETESPVGRLLLSVGFVVAASRIRADRLAERVRRIDSAMTEATLRIIIVGSIFGLLHKRAPRLAEYLRRWEIAEWDRIGRLFGVVGECALELSQAYADYGQADKAREMEQLTQKTVDRLVDCALIYAMHKRSDENRA